MPKENTMADLDRLKSLLGSYALDLNNEQIARYTTEVDDAQRYFPEDTQKALLFKLLNDADLNHDDRVIATSTIACRLDNGICVTTFGILSPDWPGLSTACLGVIHAMGWNIYFVKGFTIHRSDKDMGAVIIGVRTDDEEDYQKLMKQTTTILSRLVNAAQVTKGKANILFEEIRKILIYSSVITQIENLYQGDDLEALIGPEGEAVHYFNARSRDYIENRSVPDIAQQIVRNYTLIRNAHETSTIQMDICNLKTKSEGRPLSSRFPILFSNTTGNSPPNREFPVIESNLLISWDMH